MRLFTTTAIILCAMTIGSTSSHAQESDTSFCNWGDLAPERLIGDGYTIEVTPFLVLTAETPTYVGEGGEAPGEIDYDAGEFLLIGMPPPIPTVRLSQDLVDDRPWVWRGDDVLNANISSEDLEILTGCEIENLPRLEGYFETQSQDGHLISHLMQFVVLHEDLLIGYWRWEGSDGTAEVKRLGGMRLTREVSD